MTAEYPFCSQDESLYGAMDSQGFYGIFRTAGIVPAAFRQCGRNDPLVNFDGNRQKGHQEPSDPPEQEEFLYPFPKT
jgi:hypothetical protein